MIRSTHAPSRSPGFSHSRFRAIALFVLALAVNCSPAASLTFKFDHEAFTQWIQERLQKSTPPTEPPSAWKAKIRIEPHPLKADPDKRRAFWITCGGGFSNRFVFEQRATKLPDDPTLILASGYRSCQRMDIFILEPRVPVAFYPTGYFGDYVYENILVKDRMELFDETLLRQLFLLIAEGAIAVNDLEAYWFDEPQLVQVTDFRKESHFIPELVIEMVSPDEVRIELDFTHEKILIQKADRWESYLLDPGAAAAIRKIVADEQIKNGQTALQVKDPP